MAATGTHDLAGWSGVDSLPPGAVLVPRYATDPVFTAPSPEPGTMTFPTINTPYFAWPAPSPSPTATIPTLRVPKETFTATFNGTKWSVVGSVSGAQGTATPGASFTSTNGRISFTISNGAYATGDKYTFDVTDFIDATQSKNHQSYKVADDDSVILASDSKLWNFPVGVYGSTIGGNANGDQLAIRDNGYISLQTSGQYPFLPSLSNNEPLPTRKIFTGYDNSSAFIAEVLPFWDDLAPKGSSRIWVAQTGPDGAHMLTVEWVDFAHKNDPTASYTFEAVFFENQDMVRFHYITMTNGSGSFADGSSATVGVQRSLLRTYTANQYGFDMAGLLSNGLAVEFGNDADGDLMSLGVELQYGTDPNNASSDGAATLPGGSSSLSDTAQIADGRNPLDASDNASALSVDPDGDGICSAQEKVLKTDPAKADTDGDGLDDNKELLYGTDPLKTDSDGDGISDGAEDANHNGVFDTFETNATRWDTDGDGVSDGLERLKGTDPSAAPSVPLTKQVQVSGCTSSKHTAAAVDSKGNLHVLSAGSCASKNRAPDDIYAALYVPDGMGGYKLAVAPTLIGAHIGSDDTYPSIGTLAGTGAIDRTFLFNGDRGQGQSFFTELDFNRAALDGTASTSATLVVRSRTMILPTGVQHPDAKMGPDGNLHVVYQGQIVKASNGNRSGSFIDTKVERGIYYLKLSPAGDILAGPIELYKRPPPNHPHVNPQITFDAGGAVHGLFRAGSCAWDSGPTNCSIYYFKLATDGTILVPATALKLDGMGGIDKMPRFAVSPNGNINIVYASIAPRIHPISAQNTCGGYCYGRPVFLHVINTSNGIVQTVVNQKILMSDRPTVAVNSGPFNTTSPVSAVFHTPDIAVDAGGNLHVFSGEDENSNTQAYYQIFDPTGEPKVGPLVFPQSNSNTSSGGHVVVRIAGTRAFLVWRNNSSQLTVTSFDFSGLGLDMTGVNQPPVPSAMPIAITGVNPSTAAPGTSVTVDITGDNFVGATTATIGGVALANVTVWSAQKLSGTLPASNGLGFGSYDVTVSNPGSATLGFGSYDVTVSNPGSATLAGGFHIGAPSPAPSAVLPNPVPQGVDTTAVLVGANFQVGMTIQVDGMAAAGVSVLSDGAAEFTAAKSLAVGAHDVTATNTDGQSGTLKGGLVVGAGGPSPSPLAITAVLPATISNEVAETITIIGAGFDSGATVDVGSKSETAMFLSASALKVTLAKGYAAGTYDVKVTSSDGKSATAAMALTVVNGPSSNSGCGCTVGAAAPASNLGWWAALALLVFVLRRRSPAVGRLLLGLFLLGGGCHKAPPAQNQPRLSKGWQSPTAPFVPDNSDVDRQRDKWLASQQEAAQPSRLVIRDGGTARDLDPAEFGRLAGASIEDGGVRRSVVELATQLFPGRTWNAIQFVAADGTTLEAPFSAASRDPQRYQVKLNRKSQFKVELPPDLKLVRATGHHIAADKALPVREIRFL